MFRWYSKKQLSIMIYPLNKTFWSRIIQNNHWLIRKKNVCLVLCFFPTIFQNKYEQKSTIQQLHCQFWIGFLENMWIISIVSIVAIDSNDKSVIITLITTETTVLYYLLIHIYIHIYIANESNNITNLSVYYCRYCILQKYVWSCIYMYRNKTANTYTLRQSNVAKVRRFSIAMSDHSRVVNCGKHNSKPSPK